jgi:hypothetical protein
MKHLDWCGPFTILNCVATYGSNNGASVKLTDAVMANLNPDMVVEILKLLLSLSVGTGVALILAWQSPKLLRELLSFTRLLLKDWRGQPKVEKQPKTPQISKPQ